MYDPSLFRLDGSVAVQVWTDFWEKSQQRARTLNPQGNESLTSVLEKEA